MNEPLSDQNQNKRSVQKSTNQNQILIESQQCNGEDKSNQKYITKINGSEYSNQFIVKDSDELYNIEAKHSSNQLTRSKIEEQESQLIAEKTNVFYDECPLHKKPLDILCLIEKVVICSSCALFGNHKGHQFKNSDEIEKDVLKKQQLIMNIIDQKTQIQENKNTSLDAQIFEGFLKQKKEEIVNKLSEHTKNLLEEVYNCQRQCLQKINAQFEKSMNTFYNFCNKLEDNKVIYKRWEDKALQYVQKLLKTKTIHEKVKILNKQQKDEQIMKQGKNILLDMNVFVKELEKQKNQLPSAVYINFDNSILKKIKQYARVETSSERQHNNFHIQHYNSNISLSSNILDEPLITQTNGPTNIKAETSMLSLETSMRLNRASPLYKSSLMLSPRRQKNIREEMSSLNKGRYKSPTHKPQTPIEIARYRRIKLKINEKYDKIMEEVIADNTEIFDLTNGELGNEITLQMLDLLKANSKVRILKLGKNRLNDEMLPDMWKHLVKIQTLNLSNNHFSEKIIDSFMSHLPSVPLLKNLVVTQNKIIPRSLKAKIEELKQIGILVTV